MCQKTKTLTLLVMLFIFINSCTKSKNVILFNKIITNNISKDSIVDFSTIFPFKWKKMYIFNRNIYREAKGDDISKIIGFHFNNNHNYDDRLIIFTQDNKVVFEVVEAYETDDFNDYLAPFKYNFFLGNKPLPFLSTSNAKFSVKKYKDGYILIPLSILNKKAVKQPLF